jgi:hypothetical protein
MSAESSALSKETGAPCGHVPLYIYYSTPRSPLYHCLGDKCDPITYAQNVSIQSHMSTLAYILSIFQECDITGSDIKDVNQWFDGLVTRFGQLLSLPFACLMGICPHLLQPQFTWSFPWSLPLHLLPWSFTWSWIWSSNGDSWMFFFLINSKCILLSMIVESSWNCWYIAIVLQYITMYSKSILNATGILAL